MKTVIENDIRAVLFSLVSSNVSTQSILFRDKLNIFVPIHYKRIRKKSFFFLLHKQQKYFHHQTD